MKQVEAVNRLLHEIKKAKSYWQENKLEIEDVMIQMVFNEEGEEPLQRAITDVEIGEALKNLIKAMQEER